MSNTHANFKRVGIHLVLKSLFVVSLSIALGWFVFQQQYKSKIADIKSIQEEKLLTAVSLASRELGSIRDIMHLIGNSQSLKRATPSSSLTQRSITDNEKRQVIDYFIHFGNASPKISQIRWIDMQGQEMVRVDFESGQFNVVEEGLLQNKQSRYYVKQGLKVPAPDIYISPIDLNVEYNKVVVPFQPTVRATILTGEAKHMIKGLIVVNYQLSNLLESVRQLSSAEAQISIVNQQGYWLLHPQPEKEWGFMLNKPDNNMSNDNPSLWQTLSSNQASVGSIEHEALFTYRTLPIFESQYTDTDNNAIYLISQNDTKAMAAAEKRSMWLGMISGGIILIIGFMVTLRESRFQSRLLTMSDELKQEKKELSHLNRRLQENLLRQQNLQNDLVEAKKLSSLGMMVAGVAHELNTPIGGSSMSISDAKLQVSYLQKAMQDGMTKSMLRDTLEHINASLTLSEKNMSKAAELIKSFKRMAIDRANDDFIQFDLADVINDLMVSLNSRLKSTKVKVELDIGSGISMLSRPGTISQVVENLINNSLDHAFNERQSGQIIVSAKTEQTQADQQSYVRLAISDNGCGIPHEMQSHIFEPFVTSGRGKGNTGLGLYLVHQWVTQVLKGSISLHSSPAGEEQSNSHDKITEFVLLLPTDISKASIED